MNYLKASTDPTPAPPMREMPSLQKDAITVHIHRSPVAQRIYAKSHTVGKRKHPNPLTVLDLMTKPKRKAPPAPIAVKTNWP